MSKGVKSDDEAGAKLVESYKMTYTSDGSSDATLTLYLKGVGAIERAIKPSQIAAVIAMLNGSTVHFNPDPDSLRFYVTPKKTKNALV